MIDIKIGTQNHSRCLKNMGVVVAEGARLLGGTFGSDNNVFLLNRLNPEPWRIIGQIGNERHEWPAGVNGVPAFRNLAIKVRDYRDKEVGRVFAPEFFEKPRHGPVKNPDRKLQNPQEILAA